MKGLDTGVLLALLEGRGEANDLLKRLSGEEVGTTELNMFELETVARSAPAGARARRLAALDRLRRKLTVLAVTEGSVHAASTISAGGSKPVPSMVALVCGAFVASGVSEVYSTEAGRLQDAGSGLKVITVRRKGPKKRH